MLYRKETCLRTSSTTVLAALKVRYLEVAGRPKEGKEQPCKSGELLYPFLPTSAGIEGGLQSLGEWPGGSRMVEIS